MILSFVSYKIHKELHETKVFERIHTKLKFPIFYLLKNYFNSVIVGSAMIATLSASTTIFIIFMPTYLQKILTLNIDFASIATLLVTITSIITALFVGIISDNLKCNYWIKQILR